MQTGRKIIWKIMDECGQPLDKGIGDIDKLEQKCKELRKIKGI